MAWKYAIMHLDDTAAIIDSEGLCHIAMPDLLPCNLSLEEGTNVSTRVENLSNFYYWCASRVLTPDRKFAKENLNAIGAGQGYTDRDRARIALTYRCVALTDVFWVRDAGEAVAFSQVNLYEHPLSDAFVDVSLFGRALTAENMALLKPLDSAGDASTQGAVPKAWIRRDGVFLSSEGRRAEGCRRRAPGQQGGAMFRRRSGAI